MRAETPRDSGREGAPSSRGRRRSIWKTPTLLTALLLLIPALGNQYVDGWNWAPLAFVRIGAILFGVGVSYELVTRKSDAIAYRAAVGLALAGALVLVWVNFIQFADGVNRAAAMYLGVPFVGLVGAVVSQVQPRGMSRALFATALAQGLVLSTALFVRSSESASWTAAVWRGFGLNAALTLLFVGSALLFRVAGRGPGWLTPSVF